jgi:ABC-type multidrug transport system fused ATPase/permease subunit
MTTIARSTKVLSRKDQRKIAAVVFIQISLGALDLLGVAIIGLLGALSVSGVKSSQPGNRINEILELVHIQDYSFQHQVAILGSLATLVLVARTLFSMFFIRKTLHFLSRQSATISSNLVSRMLSQNLLELQKKSSMETVFAVTQGVTAITNGVIGSAVALISDGSMLVVMTLGLLLVDPVLALSTMVIFGVIGIALYKLMHQKARNLGRETTEYNVRSNEKILEVLNSYRESVVRNRRSYYAKEIGEIRFKLARTEAEAGFLPYVSKYVIETTLVLGALLISAVQFSLQDAVQAVATLAIFLAAGTRIAPAILRIQQGALQIKGALGSASPTLELIEQLEEIEPIPTVEDKLDLQHLGFDPVISVKSLTFRYHGSQRNSIHNLTFEVSPGEILAIVGPSGAGKTTLVDLLLGVLPMERGEILISHKDPLEAVKTWPGAISYVPQDVTIINGTIRENVALGFGREYATDELVSNCLRIAQLEMLINESEYGLDTPVGDHGTKLSGGQRQRLGIARAMFTNPTLLVLDEATSSLDGQTEADFSDAVNKLKGEVTVILIAHRLSTVRAADQVIYLDRGEMLAKGTFDSVRTAVPDFDSQAKLMGL